MMWAFLASCAFLTSRHGCLPSPSSSPALSRFSSAVKRPGDLPWFRRLRIVPSTPSLRTHGRSRGRLQALSCRATQCSTSARRCRSSKTEPHVQHAGIITFITHSITSSHAMRGQNQALVLSLRVFFQGAALLPFRGDRLRDLRLYLHGPRDVHLRHEGVSWPTAAIPD